MSKIEYLLFDLDDTLYTDKTGLFKEVGDRIEHWTAQTLGVSLDAAKALRRTYYETYGTTMAGLLQEHPDVDIDAYLDYVHDIDVSKYLQRHAALATMLAKLPVSKVIFTNSIMTWAERVTRQLGIRKHFERIFDVRAVGYRSKPNPYAYAWVLEQLQVPADACVMLDDQPSYLAGAAEAGMHTILVRRNGVAHEGVEYAVPHILDAEVILHELIDS